MCALLKAARSGYYQWRLMKRSRRETENEALKEAIREVYERHEGRYGSPRIAIELNLAGIATSKNRVARHMQRMGLVSKSTPKRKRHASARRNDLAENLVGSMGAITERNRVCVGDITYIPVGKGFMYMAGYLDLCLRKIVGWSLGDRMTSGLVIEALINGIGRQRPGKGLIVHTDRGSQYSSYRYLDILGRNGFIASVSRPGNPYDNAFMESFYRTLKTELLQGKRFLDKGEAERKIFEYIEIYYNRKRMHSSLGYQSPEEYEKRFNSNNLNPVY